MPVEKISINKLQVIKNIQCEKVPDLMIVAGPNGVGKSTFLEAIAKYLIGQHYTGVELQISDKAKPVYLPPHRTPFPFEFHKSIAYSTQAVLYRDEMSKDTSSFNDPTRQTPQFFTSGIRRSRLFPDFSPYFQVKTKLGRYKADFANVLAEVYKKKGEVPKGYVPDIFGPVKQVVSYLLPGINFVNVELEGEVFKIIFSNRSGELVEFDNLSSGEKDIICMLFPLIEKQVENLLTIVKGESTASDDLVILMDTPEANLHPSLQNIFLNFVRNSIRNAKKQGEKLQFILVTHSSIIINEADASELFLITFPDQNEIQLIGVKDLDLHTLHWYLGNLGLSAFTFGKPILLLEGKDDEELLRLLMPKLEADFVLYHLNGKERVRGFIDAFDNLISELNSRGIQVFGIFDKDREKIIMNKSSSTQKTLFPLPVYCMENLFLKSDFVFESLKVLGGQTKLDQMKIKNPQDIDNLKKSIINNADFYQEELKTRINEELSLYVNVDDINNLNTTSIGERIDSIASQRKSKLIEILTKLENDLKNYIQNENYRELNGKSILKKIAQNFGLKYDVLARDIADRMNDGGYLPEELKSIISIISKK